MRDQANRQCGAAAVSLLGEGWVAQAVETFPMLGMVRVDDLGAVVTRRPATETDAEAWALVVAFRPLNRRRLVAELAADAAATPSEAQDSNTKSAAAGPHIWVVAEAAYPGELLNRVLGTENWETIPVGLEQHDFVEHWQYLACKALLSIDGAAGETLRFMAAIGEYDSDEGYRALRLPIQVWMTQKERTQADAIWHRQMWSVFEAQERHALQLRRRRLRERRRRLREPNA